MNKMKENDTWRKRRFVIYSTITLSWIVILGCMLFPVDPTVAGYLVVGAFGQITAVVGFFIGGAAYEDVRKKGK